MSSREKRGGETADASQKRRPGESCFGNVNNSGLPEEPWSGVVVPEMANNTNVLAQGIEIVGTIKFTNDMIIDGKVDGEIQSQSGTVTIGENASIKGDVKAGEVKMYGKVEGTITSDRCELMEKSELKGNIKTNKLTMQEGALLSGRMETGH